MKYLDCCMCAGVFQWFIPPFMSSSYYWDYELHKSSISWLPFSIAWAGAQVFFSHHLTEWLVSVYFSYMNTMLIVQFMWSLGLACVDMYSIRNKKDLHNSLVVTLVVIGDWVSHLLYILCCPCSYVWKHALRQFNPKFCSVVVLKTSCSNGNS
jgi:hypothetical protein